MQRSVFLERVELLLSFPSLLGHLLQQCGSEREGNSGCGWMVTRDGLILITRIQRPSPVGAFLSSRPGQLRAKDPSPSMASTNPLQHPSSPPHSPHLPPETLVLQAVGSAVCWLWGCWRWKHGWSKGVSQNSEQGWW